MARGPIFPNDTYTDMRFALAGIDRTMGFTRQPSRPLVDGSHARTCVYAKNVRAFEPGTDRARGGSRPGIHKYSTNQINGTNSTQELNYIAVPGLVVGGSGTVPGWGIATPQIFLRRLSTVDLCHGTASSAWQVPTTAFGPPYVVAIGNNAGSTVFSVRAVQGATATTADTATWQIHKNGSLVAQGACPGQPAALSISLATDATSFYAVGMNKGTGAGGAGTFFAIKVSTTGTVSWSTANVGTLTTTTHHNHTSSSVIISGVIYTLFVGTGVVQTDAALGVAGSPLVKATQAAIRAATTGSNYVPERGDLLNRTVIRPSGFLSNVGNVLAIAVEHVNNTVNWQRGVVFYNVASELFSPSFLAPSSLTDSAGAAARNRRDNFLSLATDGTDFYALVGNLNSEFLGTNNFVVKITASTGLRAWGSDHVSALTGASARFIGYSSSLTSIVVSGAGLSKQLNPTTGAVTGGGLGSGIYGMFDAGEVNDNTQSTADDGETVGGYNRALCMVGVAGGTAKVLFQNEWMAVNAGGGTLSTTARVIRSAVNRGKLFFVDDRGGNYTYYDPKPNKLYAWTATQGTMPTDNNTNKARLLETWRGRSLLAGFPEDPNNIYASAQNDSFNFNFAPPSPSPTQAWALNAAALGQLPDIVTAMIPYSDDYCFIGCDHEIWRLSGDPAAGGKLDMVSRQLGVAWGRAWCTDPFGGLYIFSNHCGIFVLSPNEQPIRISQPIDGILRDIDLRKVVVRLVWNDRAQGMHIWVTHISGAQPDQHYFWEQRSGAWWIDTFADDDHNPLCAISFQGNTGSGRVVAIGSFDGYVRFVTENAPNDDGEDIEGEMWFGPILTRDMDDVLLKEIQVELGRDSGPVTYAIHVGSTAEAAFMATAVESGTLVAGRNNAIPTRWAGNGTYIKFGATDEWAMEAIRARISGTGNTRRRQGAVHAS